MLSDIRTGLFLALKNIFRKKLLFSLIVLIIALGFINMVFFTSFINGMMHALDDGVITMQYGNIIIQPKEDDIYIDNADSILRKVRSVSGVSAATRRYDLSAVLTNEQKEKTIGSWMFQAIDPEEEKEVTITQDFLIGQYLSQNDRDQIVLGAHLAGTGGAAKFMPIGEALEVGEGDKITVTYSNGLKKEYRVKGVIDGRDFFAVMSAYITIKEAEDILNLSNKASNIYVRVPTGQEEQFIRKFKELGINQEIRRWEDKAGQANLISGLFSVVNKIFYAVGIIIIFFTIYVATNINVINNRKQFGILKAIGVRRLTIKLSYVFTAVFYGIFGILLAMAIMKIITVQLAGNPVDTPLGFVYPVLKESLLWTSVFVVFVGTIIGSYIPITKERRKNIISLIWG
jgi:putative ABC transport system permease protein